MFDLFIILVQVLTYSSSKCHIHTFPISISIWPMLCVYVWDLPWKSESVIIIQFQFIWIFSFSANILKYCKVTLCDEYCNYICEIIKELINLPWWVTVTNASPFILLFLSVLFLAEIIQIKQWFYRHRYF